MVANQNKTKEEIAQEYAQEHGIVEYKVKGNRMIYYENSESQTENTVKVIVRLNTLTVERQKLNYFNPKGNLNMKAKER